MSNFCFYWNSISILWALWWVSHRKVEKQKLSQNHHNTAGLASCGPKTKIIKIEKKRNGARARRHKNDKNDAAARNPISHPRVTSVFNLRLSLYYHRERERVPILKGNWNKKMDPSDWDDFINYSFNDQNASLDFSWPEQRYPFWLFI